MVQRIITKTFLRVTFLTESFILVDSLPLYEQYKPDFTKAITEYFLWAFQISIEINPIFKDEWNKHNKISFDVTIEHFKQVIHSGIPDKEIDEQRKAFFNGDNFYVFLINEKAIAGIAAFKKIDNVSGVLKTVYVRPSYRGKGYGESIIIKIIEIVRNKNYKKLKLETAPFFKSARKIYSKLGFKPIAYFPEDSFPKDWSEKMKLLYMELEL